MLLEVLLSSLLTSKITGRCCHVAVVVARGRGKLKKEHNQTRFNPLASVWWYCTGYLAVKRKLWEKWASGSWVNSTGPDEAGRLRSQLYQPQLVCVKSTNECRSRENLEACRYQRANRSVRWLKRSAFGDTRYLWYFGAHLICFLRFWPFFQNATVLFPFLLFFFWKLEKNSSLFIRHGWMHRYACCFPSSPTLLARIYTISTCASIDSSARLQEMTAELPQPIKQSKDLTRLGYEDETYLRESIIHGWFSRVDVTNGMVGDSSNFYAVIRTLLWPDVRREHSKTSELTLTLLVGGAHRWGPLALFDSIMFFACMTSTYSCHLDLAA